MGLLTTEKKIFSLKTVLPILIFFHFKGSKGRKIAVLYEASGHFSAETSSQKRAPSFLEELT